MKKTIICVVLVICFVLSMTASVLAVDANWAENDLSDLLGFSARNYYTESGHEQSDPEYQISELYVIPSVLEFDYSNEVEYVDVIAKLDDGAFRNVTEWATAEISSMIVTYDMGRVDSIGQGSSSITISYGEMECILAVEVQNGYNPNLISTTDATITPYNLETGAVLRRANECYNYTWTPTQNLTKWRGNGVYTANQTVSGLPYTQATQAYPVSYSSFALLSFDTALSYSNFYEPYVSGGITMPRYGLDCSGFLSYCMGTSRKTTQTFLSGLYNGTYSAVGAYDPSDFMGYSGGYYVLNLTTALKNELIDAYDSTHNCQDALVNSGHCMLIVGRSSSNSELTVREQTPTGTVARVYSYQELADAGYLPFRFL